MIRQIACRRLVAFFCWLALAPWAVADEGEAAKKAAEAEKEKAYFEMIKLFADTLDQVDRNYVKEIDRRKLIEGAIRGMLAELDPHSGYISPQQLEQFRTGVENEFGGVGVKVVVEGEDLKVLSPLPGSPAYRAGVQAGDIIQKIGGKSAKGITIDEARRRLKGEIGTAIPVVIFRREAMLESEFTVSLKREIIRVHTVFGDHRNADDSWNWWCDSTHKIAYVRITGFGRHTIAELRAAMKKIAAQNHQGLVLDLRYNPGGLLSSAIEVCDLFLSEGKIVSTEGRSTAKRTWSAHKRGAYEDFPMVVLVNGYSASASEIVSACLQDHKRAVVIGERTWGKGSVQNIINLEDGASAMKLTTSSYLRPSGKNIHRFPDAKDEDDWGVHPNKNFEVKFSDTEKRKLAGHFRRQDYILSPTQKANPAKQPAPFQDRQLQKAIEYLTGRIQAGEGAE